MTSIEPYTNTEIAQLTALARSADAPLVWTAEVVERLLATVAARTNPPRGLDNTPPAGEPSTPPDMSGNVIPLFTSSDTPGSGRIVGSSFDVAASIAGWERVDSDKPSTTPSPASKEHT